MNKISIPFGPFRGKDAAERKHQAYLDFAAGLEAIQLTLESRQGARDWCYHLEDHGLLKPDFDKAESRIGTSRKDGYLPVDFILEDANRIHYGGSGLGKDYPVEEEMDWIWEKSIQGHLENYCPINWVDYQPHYIEMLTEKRGLVELFKPTADEFHFNLQNGKGDTDIISIAKIHRRFQDAEKRGQKCVLLYCGDFDPKGIQISDILQDRFNDAVGQRFIDGTVLREIDLEVNRIGLDLETINELSLSRIPNLLTGRDAKYIKGADGKQRLTVETPLNHLLHPDHQKEYVQSYLRMIDYAETGKAWKVEANALMKIPKLARELLRRAMVPYIDQDGVEAYESDLEDARSALSEALPEFLANKLAA